VVLGLWRTRRVTVAKDKIPKGIAGLVLVMDKLA